MLLNLLQRQGCPPGVCISSEHHLPFSFCLSRFFSSAEPSRNLMITRRPGASAKAASTYKNVRVMRYLQTCGSIAREVPNEHCLADRFEAAGFVRIPEEGCCISLSTVVMTLSQIGCFSSPPRPSFLAGLGLFLFGSCFAFGGGLFCSLLRRLLFGSFLARAVHVHADAPRAAGGGEHDLGGAAG